MSLAVRPGDRLALLGPSGSGKSTLARVISGHQTPTAGRISLDDRERILSNQLLAGFEGVFLIEQEAGLPAYTRLAATLAKAYANLGELARAEAIAALAERYLLGPLLQLKPEQMSTGQRQRALIGLAAASRAWLIVADEPFSHQDAWTRQYLSQTLGEDLTAGRKALILSTHVLEEAQVLTDIVLYLSEGQPMQPMSWQSFSQEPAGQRQALYGPLSLLSRQADSGIRLSLDDRALGSHTFTVVSCLPYGTAWLASGTDAGGAQCSCPVPHPVVGTLTAYRQA